MIDYHYQIFLVLADCLDYAKTAQELCLSKPAVTQHIQYLETDLEVKLFRNYGGNLAMVKKEQLLKKCLVVFNDQIDNLLRLLATK